MTPTSPRGSADPEGAIMNAAEAAYDRGHACGLRDARERLLSDEAVERAAAALVAEFAPTWGDPTPDERVEMWTPWFTNIARTALANALGEGGQP